MFYNTYDHNWINNISIAAFNETYRQYLGPAYAYM